ncbi:MAG: c-type cytochrome, partial [Verrucomicrobiota bacterium]
RSDPASFDRQGIDRASIEMGKLEMEAAVIEAETYRSIRASMTENQIASMMDMRGNYTLDESQVTPMTVTQRGEALSVLCSGCHGSPGAHKSGMPAPTLDGFWDRPIATAENFEFSESLQTTGQRLGGTWTPDLLDQFIANPKQFASGTKMEFQGLLNADDREALIQFLQKSR